MDIHGHSRTWIRYVKYGHAQDVAWFIAELLTNSIEYDIMEVQYSMEADNGIRRIIQGIL